MRLKPNTEAVLRNAGLLVLRVSAGLAMMIAHGIPKIERLSADPVRFADPFGIGAKESLMLAIFAEVACSAALVLGLLTRLAAIPLIATMGVAAFYAHAGDPFSDKELALAYMVIYVALLGLGPGAWSVDARLFAKK